MPSATLDGSIVIARESLADVLDEIAPLIVAHWREVHPYRDLKVDPDLDLYLTAEARGMLRVFIARICGVLVGYSIFFVLESPQVRGLIQAKHEVLYLDPDYRRGLTGLRLIAECDRELKAEGVAVVHHSVRPRNDFSPILERLGYEKTEAIYSRRLDKES
jgi:hypothetical protein